ncbi:hypothetical protein LEP1GSC108_3586 [Leptospira weilii str. UI 13098]|uniref:Uncharacterized protein n=1 Tax=Leptospira weilii str. UI 13098 TaxID=1088542 RepID=M6Q2Q3_9LEPT|nr:hypothetical protein LEP1GSC108_3586 [Leptospira weilii str. UI 13098]
MISTFEDKSPAKNVQEMIYKKYQSSRSKLIPIFFVTISFIFIFLLFQNSNLR